MGSNLDSWPSCIGHFGIGNLNENGQRLLELCSYHNLCITNMFFSTKPHYQFSWWHPLSRHWHQLNLIITQIFSLTCVLVTRSFHSAKGITDHCLVGCKMRLQPKQKDRPHINTAKTAIPDLCSVLPTPSRMPSKTALLTALKRGGITYVMPSRTPPWTPLVEEKGRKAESRLV